jgi:hypothetical protein
LRKLDHFVVLDSKTNVWLEEREIILGNPEKKFTILGKLYGKKVE